MKSGSLMPALRPVSRLFVACGPTHAQRRSEQEQPKFPGGKGKALDTSIHFVLKIKTFHMHTLVRKER